MIQLNKKKIQGLLANLQILSKYINSNFDGLGFKNIELELDQFSIDVKQEEIEDIAVFKEDWSKLNKDENHLHRTMS